MSELLETGTIYDRFYHLFFDWPDIVVFTLFFTLAILCANALTFVAATVSSQSSGETTKENFARYGLALLPLVMTGFMAYHLYYLINMGVYFPIVLWQTFHFSIFEQDGHNRSAFMDVVRSTGTSFHRRSRHNCYQLPIEQREKRQTDNQEIYGGLATSCGGYNLNRIPPSRYSILLLLMSQIKLSRFLPEPFIGFLGPQAFLQYP